MSDIIVGIISGCVALVLGVIGVLANSWLQRKNNSIEIITKKRLDRRDELIDISTRIIKLTDKDYIATVAMLNWNGYVNDLIQACSELRAILEFEYEKDLEFVTTAYELKKSIIDNNGKCNGTWYIEGREKLLKIMDVYTSTEWQRIKRETVGEIHDAKKGYDWTKMYTENSTSYDNQVKEKDVSAIVGYTK